MTGKKGQTPPPTLDWDQIDFEQVDPDDYGEYYYNKYNHVLDGNFFNNVFFFFNIISYLVFCSYLAIIQYPDLDYTTVRDRCVEGAWYEMNLATQLGTN